MLIVLAKSRLEKDVILAGPKQGFLYHPTTAHLPMIKTPPKNKKQQNNAFCLPLIGFPHKVHKIRIEKQANIPS